MSLRHLLSKPLVGALVTAVSLAAVPALATPASASDPTSALQPSLLEHLESVSATAPVRVLVQADGNVAAVKNAIARAGLVPNVSLPRIGMATAIGTRAQIAALGRDVSVSRVDWADQPLEYFGDTSNITTRTQPVHEGAVDLDGDGVTEKYTGKGFSVAIVDSGTDGTHPYFLGPDGTSRVKRNMKMVCHDIVGDFGSIFVPEAYQTAADCMADLTAVNDTDTLSNGGHGTHVTGIAAGGIVTDASGRHLRGAAPDAEIVSVSTGEAITVLSGTLAMYWVLEHHADPCAGSLVPGADSCDPIVAVNNSWGVSDVAFDPTDPEDVVARALVAEGVVVNWAAGNDGGDGSAVATNPYGLDPTLGIMSVANYDDLGTANRDNELDSSSSRGKKGSIATYPDISAPGANITSACRVYLPVCSTGLDFADPNYNTISGTSMATPQITGIVAVLQQVATKKLGRLLTPAEIELLLVDTAHHFGNRTYETDTRNPASTTGTTFDAGHGLVDVSAAVSRLTGQTITVADSGPVCTPTALFTDEAGDATGGFGQEVPGGPNADGLDILRSWLTTDAATKDVTFHWTVADLAAQPVGTAGTGEYFDYNFSYAGASYYLAVGRPTENGAPSFELGDFGGTNGTRRTLASGLPGEFDVDRDEISATLTNAVVSGTLGKPALADGASITGLEIVARRSLVLVVPDADTATGSCSYTVNAENQAPANTAPTAHAIATPSTATAGTEIALDASTSTDAETPFGLSYSWDFGDGGTTADSTSATPKVTYATAGTYTATVTVTDPDGLADTDAVVITVTEPTGGNTAPTAVASVDHATGLLGDAFVFGSTGTTDAETPDDLTYAWEFGDGATDTGATVSHTYQAAGTYTATLTVTDPAGAASTATVSVEVRQANRAPVAKALVDHRTVEVESDLTFDATGSTDADGDVLSYSWDFGDGGAANDSHRARVTTSYDEVGSYVATVTVTDPSGASSTASIPVQVVEKTVNTAPTADVVASRAVLLKGDRLVLKAKGSSDAETGVSELQYAWDFDDDGTTVDATTRRAAVNYTTPGLKIVTLTITDEGGLVDTQSVRIEVLQKLGCQNADVTLTGWRTVRSDRADGGTYCDTFTKVTGAPTVDFAGSGDALAIYYGRSRDGGVADVIVDGRTVGSVNFAGTSKQVTFGWSQTFTGLGAGDHTVRIKMADRKDDGFLDFVAY